jgi:uncharacterized membrane-anchored protein
MPLRAVLVAANASRHCEQKSVGDRTDAGAASGLLSSLADGVPMQKRQTPDKREWQARAAEALEKARRMKPGPERNEALKKAGQLQSAADMMGYLSSRELQRPK